MHVLQCAQLHLRYVIMAVLLEAPLLSHVMHLMWNTPFINGARTPLPRKSLILLVSIVFVLV